MTTPSQPVPGMEFLTAERLPDVALLICNQMDSYTLRRVRIGGVALLDSFEVPLRRDEIARAALQALMNDNTNLTLDELDIELCNTFPAPSATEGADDVVVTVFKTMLPHGQIIESGKFSLETIGVHEVQAKLGDMTPHTRTALDLQIVRPMSEKEKDRGVVNIEDL